MLCFSCKGVHARRVEDRETWEGGGLAKLLRKVHDIVAVALE